MGRDKAETMRSGGIRGEGQGLGHAGVSFLRAGGLDMLGLVQKSRFVSVVVSSFFALHCGTDPGPDGSGSGGEPGTGGDATTTGGQGFGGEAGGAADSGGSGGHEPEGPVTEV